MLYYAVIQGKSGRLYLDSNTLNEPFSIICVKLSDLVEINRVVA